MALHWTDQRKVAHVVAEHHEALAAKYPESHRAIAFCNCYTASAYRLAAADYRAERDAEEKRHEETRTG